MPRVFFNLMSALLLLGAFAVGCKPKTPESTATPPSPARPASAYFQTPYQTECEFIVGAIVSDLAEQMYFAAHQQLPDQGYFMVNATEKPGSPKDAPVYELQIRLDPKQGELKLEANINGPIWSPAVYQNMAADLARAVGASPGTKGSKSDTKLLSKLLDASPETIEKEDQSLSSELKTDFANPELHEQAALLLGAFALRDHSGYFFDLRHPLSRLTAHLVMAQFLRGSGTLGTNGQIADAISLTLSGDAVPALGLLDALGTEDSSVTAMSRALRAHNTGDYRPLNAANGLSALECIEWNCALASAAGTPVAWTKLSGDQQKTIDFVRMANQADYSVEIGHQLLDEAIPLEAAEITSIYGMTHPDHLTPEKAAGALNEMPGRCFVVDSDGTAQVHIIGWGQWANFLQRHLCHAIMQNFNLMQNYWGVPDDAKTFATRCEKSFGGLRLYPFVRRFNCTDENSYHSSVDDAFKVTIATPQLVPAECWNYLCYRVKFAPLYSPNPNPHINEWFNHNPPPGTAYDVFPRLDHPSLVSRADAMPFIEKLHSLSPGNAQLTSYILNHKYHNEPTHDEAAALYADQVSYNVRAQAAMGNTLQDQPAAYESFMVQAASLNPVYYYTLSDYFKQRHDDSKYAAYMEKACSTDPDSIRVASRAVERVRYYIKHGDVERARQIADQGGEVYSAIGLEAEGLFFELTSNYTSAFEWFAKKEERYDDSRALIAFCIRHQAATGDTQFAPEIKKRLPKLFPNGERRVSVNDFHGPPNSGVLVGKTAFALTSSPLSDGDVIVAAYGIRTDNVSQFEYERDSRADPELDYIVWHSGSYHEVRFSPPNRRFGAPISNYEPNRLQPRPATISPHLYKN